MEFQQQILLSRTHLLRMTMLSQRAVDCAVKAYLLDSLELCRQVRSSERELWKLQLSIGNRGRRLIAAGTPIDSRSPFACYSLRVYSALRVIFAASIEIAQNVKLKLEEGSEGEFPKAAEMGSLVNSLVRLCSVALFDEEIRHVKAVLQIEGGRRRLAPAHSRAHDDLNLHLAGHEGYESAITKCLGHIAEQAYELADAITLWLGGKKCLDITRAYAA